MIHSGSISLNFRQSRGWYVVVPVLSDSLQANNLGLNFWWKVSGRWNTCTSSALTVGVMTDPADVSTFTALQTLTTTDTLFHFVDVSLSAYTDTGKYIAFFDATPVGASGYSDIYIDDLSLEYAPACPRPTDLTLVNLESRTADVVWTSNADSTDYVVFYRAVTNPTVWYSDTVAGIGYTLQDLIPNTTYEVYVITLCRNIKVGRDNTYSVGANLSLPIIAPALWSNLKLSSMDIEMALEAARSSKLELVNQVKQAYFMYLLAKQSYDVLQQSYATMEASNQLVTNTYNQGLVSEFEKLRSDVALQNQKPAVNSAAKAVRLANMRLKVLLGMDINEPVVFEGKLSDYEESVLNAPLAV